MSNITNTSSSTRGGMNVAVFPVPQIWNRDPNYTDNSYPLGQLWLNKLTFDLFMLVKQYDITLSPNAGARWSQISGGTGDLVSLTGNSGGAVMADGAHNINVVGDGTTIDIVGNPGTNTLTASVISGVYPENFPVPNGTTPVVPSGAGAVSLTSTLGSVTLTGGLNTINFDVTGGQPSTSFPVDITGTQNPVLPSAMGAVTVKSSDGSIAVTGNTNEIDLTLTGGAAVTNYPVPNGTTPVVPSGAGAVTLTSSDNSVTITGGTNTIDFTTTATVPYSVQTTDATPTTLASIPVVADSATTIIVELVAADSVYGQSVHCNAMSGGQYPSAGALSLIGVPIVNILTDFATATVDITTSGNNLIVQVTGEAATTINWVGNIRSIVVDV